jgi:hypothetical protein
MALTVPLRLILLQKAKTSTRQAFQQRCPILNQIAAESTFPGTIYWSRSALCGLAPKPIMVLHGTPTVQSKAKGAI